MTFDQIVAEAMDRLNLTTPTALIRVGKDVNDRYRRLTSSIGLETSRRLPVTANTTVGSQIVTFVGVEKLLTVLNRVGTAPKDVILSQVTPDELHTSPLAGTTSPHKYAVMAIHANSVDIKIDCIPATVFTLYADGEVSLATLSAAMAPNIPESFHDILVFGAMADEYRKMEKIPLMQDAEANYEKRLSDLRMHIAKAGYMDIYQGRANRHKWYSGTNGNY